MKPFEGTSLLILALLTPFFYTNEAEDDLGDHLAVAALWSRLKMKQAESWLSARTTVIDE